MNEEHARFRAQLEAERRARREEEEARKRKALQKNKSASIPAKWRYPNGVTIAGTKIRRGMFYAGCNMKDMVQPQIAEASLVNPKYDVSYDGDFSKLGPFPIYDYMTPPQHGAYIKWLAGSRDDADDLGFVFLYLFGLERRLIVDARKPGEVSDEEHDAIIEELLRLLDCFKKKSRSLYHYITMLLLYDGRVFEQGRSQKEIESIFELDAIRFSKRFEFNENMDAYEYMLLARITSAGMKIPLDDLLNYSRLRIFRNRSAAALSMSLSDMVSSEDGKKAFELARQRFKNGILNIEAGYPASPDSNQRSGKRIVPDYLPASATLRKGSITDLNRIGSSPEDLDIPFKNISDLCLRSYSDIVAVRELLSQKSPKGIENLPIDAMSMIIDLSDVAAVLEQVKGYIAAIPISLLEAKLKSTFPTLSAVNAKGYISEQAQHVYAKWISSLGWQAMVPSAFSDESNSIARFWKIKGDGNIIAFKRGIGHSKSGIAHLGNLFGQKDVTEIIALPSYWESPQRLAYIFSWFLAASDIALDGAALKALPQNDILPKRTKIGQDNQLYLFFAMMFATYSYEISTQSLTTILSETRFNDVQSVLFTWCQRRFGNVLPQSVVEALEKLYQKSGLDKSMLLYDYHAGDYRIVYDRDAEEESEFSIDMERLSQTIEDTSIVHGLLSDSFADADGLDEQSGENEETDTDEVINESNEITSSAVVSNRADIDGVVDIIIEWYGTDDEKFTSDLLDYMIGNSVLGVETKIQAQALLSEINGIFQARGEEALIEIDGEYAYLNV